MSDAATEKNVPTSGGASAPAVGKTAKRAAAKRTRNTYGADLTVLGDRFICVYSGRLLERAVFIPGLPGAFANVPCAVAFLEETVKDAKTCENFKNALSEAYGQNVKNMVRAPLRTQLIDFGGDLDYESWMGSLLFWDVLTQEQGLSVKEMTQLKKGAPVTKRSKIEFVAGMYVIPHNKGAKAVNAIDGAEKTDPPVKGKLTPVSAIRKPEAFRKSHKDQLTVKGACVMDEAFVAHFSIWDRTTSQEPAAAKVLNKTASSLLKTDCYGPAVIIFTKKVSVKLE